MLRCTIIRNSLSSFLSSIFKVLYCNLWLFAFLHHHLPFYIYKFLVSDYNDVSHIQFAFHIFSTDISNSLGFRFLIGLQRHSIHGMMEEENIIRPHQEIQALNFAEKKFLLAVERGDVAGTRR